MLLYAIFIIQRHNHAQIAIFRDTSGDSGYSNAQRRELERTARTFLQSITHRGDRISPDQPGTQRQTGFIRTSFGNCQQFTWHRLPVATPATDLGRSGWCSARHLSVQCVPALVTGHGTRQ